MLQRLAAIPGVTSAAFVSNLPMEQTMNAIAPVEGKDYGNAVPIPRTIKSISPGLFQALGTPLVAGRDGVDGYLRTAQRRARVRDSGPGRMELRRGRHRQTHARRYQRAVAGSGWRGRGYPRR